MGLPGSVCRVLSGVDRADAPRVQRARGAAVPRCRSLRVRQRGSVLADATLSKGVARFKIRFHIGASSWGWFPGARESQSFFQIQIPDGKSVAMRPLASDGGTSRDL
jgi:hypothetical protein